MLEKLKRISNPLTIIGIFAGITETVAGVVLPFLTAPNQSTFLWFVMLFPVLLVSLFFITLNLNHKVLYAPSDFRTDEGFLFAAGEFKISNSALQDESTASGISIASVSSKTKGGVDD